MMMPLNNRREILHDLWQLSETIYELKRAFVMYHSIRRRLSCGSRIATGASPSIFERIDKGNRDHLLPKWKLAVSVARPSTLCDDAIEELGKYSPIVPVPDTQLVTNAVVVANIVIADLIAHREPLSSHFAAQSKSSKLVESPLIRVWHERRTVDAVLGLIRLVEGALHALTETFQSTVPEASADVAIPVRVPLVVASDKFYVVLDGRRIDLANIPYCFLKELAEKPDPYETWKSESFRVKGAVIGGYFRMRKKLPTLASMIELTKGQGGGYRFVKAKADVSCRTDEQIRETYPNI